VNRNVEDEAAAGAAAGQRPEQRAIWARYAGRMCGPIMGLTPTRGTRSPGLAMNTMTATAIFRASLQLTLTGRLLVGPPSQARMR
jgi:hypothetical protein